MKNKSRKYNPAMMSQLILEHQIDDCNILFTDKEELKNICTTLLIDYYKFIKFAKSLKLNVVFECVTENTRKVKYDCTGMNKEEFNKFCKENNINKVYKSRLKKKYNIV